MTAVLVNTTIAGSTSANAVTSTGMSTLTANLIVVGIGDIAIANTVTLTDNQSNTWTALTSRNDGSTARARLYYCVNPTTNASHTFTASVTSGQPIIYAAAWSGMAASPFDQESGTTGSAGTSIQPGSITPSQANCILITLVNFRGGNTGSINGSFTASTTNFVFSQHVGGGGAYLIQTSAAAANPTWSWTGANNSAVAMASFKAANSIAPITYLRRRFSN